jgi:putative ABC transport system permease protein
VRDLRHALRFLWFNKAFSATAILTLAIGLGANTALFGLLNTTAKPLPVPNPEQIVAIASEVKSDETGGFQYTFSTEALKDMQQRADAFSDVMGMMIRIGGLSADGKVSQFWLAAVSENYFTGLGVTAEVGSVFNSHAGSPARIVLGHSFWKKAFGADPNVIGKQVRVEGEPAVIIGVVPERFHGTLMAVEMDGYVAVEDLGVLTPDVNRWLYHNRKARTMQVFARMKPGIKVEEAQASADVVMNALAKEFPDSDAGIGARVIPEPLARPLPMRSVTDAVPGVHFFGMALAGLVLLLACMNVANLLLVRATAREREMAVRAALGGSRLKLVQLMVTEGLVLSMLGGITGLGLGKWVTTAFLSNLDLGSDIPLRLDAEFDARVFGFALLIAIATGVLIGIWPAWRASRADARAALHDGGRAQSDSPERQRIRRLFVVGQIAGSLVLLVVASLFVRSLWSAEQIDLGFDAGKLITARVDPKQIGYDSARTISFYDELQRRTAALPGVESVAMAFSTPMSYLVGGGAIYIEGQPVPASGQPQASFMQRVGHNYFPTMGIPIVRGRAFTAEEELYTPETRRVAIVNETMAAKYWPGEDAIGKRFRIFEPAGPLLEIVGVARDSKYVLIFESPRPFLYLPLERDISLRTLHVRAFGPPGALAPLIEREIKDLAPELPIADLQTMRQSLAGLFGFLIFRVGSIQAGGMGILGLMLALIGVYGVVSFGASLRTREIGIRVALGAQPADVLKLILGQGLQLVVAGLVIGLGVSIALSRTLASAIPLVNGSDWFAFAVVALGLAALALWSCYIPARRATKVPVTTALRHE